MFDIPQSRPIEVTAHRAYRGLCPHCGATTDASLPDEVTAAAQYGANIAVLAIDLQYWHLIPDAHLAELMRDVFGVELSAATIAAFAQRKAAAWSGLAGHIGEPVRHAAVTHMDATGLRIAGMLPWLHVASTRLLPFYRTSGKRGENLAGVSGIVVHDFWRSYFTMAGMTQALCNAQHLRELKALIEIETEPWALAMVPVPAPCLPI